MKLLTPRPSRTEQDIDGKHAAIAVVAIISLILMFGIMSYLKFGAHPV